MIAFTCGIVIGSAFGACMMGLLLSSCRERFLLEDPGPGPTP
jgi:hypothetical protein